MSRTAATARTASSTPRSNSIAQRVTAQISAALEHGVRPWLQPWASNAATAALDLPRRANGLAYRGINILILWAAARDNGYAARTWCTYNQAHALGAHVRQGERGTPIVFYARAAPGTAPDAASPHTDAGPDTTPAATPDAAPRHRAILRSYVVFNADQLDNCPAAFHPPPLPPPPPPDAVETCLAQMFNRVPACIEHGGDRAYYSPAHDRIRLPPRSAFTDAAQYYATLSHELAHWTRHPTRLNRDLNPSPCGSAGHAAYAREELVAELTAAFLGAELHLPPDHIEDHASYIDHWLKTLSHDPSALLTAARHAQAAADYLRQFLQPARHPTA